MQNIKIPNLVSFVSLRSLFTLKVLKSNWKWPSSHVNKIFFELLGKDLGGHSRGFFENESI